VANPSLPARKSRLRRVSFFSRLYGTIILLSIGDRVATADLDFTLAHSRLRSTSSGGCVRSLASRSAEQNDSRCCDSSSVQLSAARHRRNFYPSVRARCIRDVFETAPRRADIWMASFLQVELGGLVLFGAVMRKLLPLDTLTRQQRI